MRIEVEKHTPFDQETRDEIVSLLGRVYWRANSITFQQYGFVLVSEDQGGHPFEAIKFEATTSPKAIAKAGLALARAIHDERG